tara:strand:- start:1624 stop:2598 length:975 start_codon:yes stop_codon:yes gene_type:complete
MKLDKKDNIFIAGHKGMVGSAIKKCFEEKGFDNIIIEDRTNLDLTSQSQVSDFFKKNKIDKVVIAAAKVGGIGANSKYPVDFLIDNLYIQSNLLRESQAYDIDQVLFLGSSCIYPKITQNPIKEDQLMSGKLEATNEWYALAKIAGIKLSEAYNIQFKTDFRSIMPTNLYGPEDNFDLENGHVIPALINKFFDAVKNNLDSVEIWGSGNPQREFLHVNDLANAVFFIMSLEKEVYSKFTKPSLSHINIGTGEDISIKQLVKKLTKISGFKGEIIYNTDKPDGTIKKALDVSKIESLGWKHNISLDEGLEETFKWYSNNYPQVRK